LKLGNSKTILSFLTEEGMEKIDRWLARLDKEMLFMICATHIT